jgi:hypothetical protein
MPHQEWKTSLSRPRRKELFLALVDAQDQGMSILQSRHVVARQFRVSNKQVRQVEQEGLDNEWPPL